MESTFDKYRNPILITAALFLIWGVLGVLDFKNFTHMGYSTDNSFNIIEVEEGSPAMAAGLQVGDHIKSIDGIDMEDSKTWNTKPRAAVGETRTWLVDRSGEEVEVNATYAAMDAKGKTLNYIGFLIGLLFIASAIWIARTNRSKAGMLYTIFALCLGFAFFTGPYFANPAIRNVVNILGFCVVMVGLAYLTNFMLNYPTPRPIVGKKNFSKILLAPAVILVVIFLALTIFQPDATQGLRMIITLISGIVILFYFGWSLILMVQRYMNSSSEDRNKYGLTLMLIGTVLALAPLLFNVVMNAVASQVVIPGSDYFFIFFGLIPICFALAINRGGSVVAS